MKKIQKILLVVIILLALSGVALYFFPLVFRSAYADIYNHISDAKPVAREGFVQTQSTYSAALDHKGLKVPAMWNVVNITPRDSISSIGFENNRKVIVSESTDFYNSISTVDENLRGNLNETWAKKVGSNFAIYKLIYGTSPADLETFDIRSEAMTKMSLLSLKDIFTAMDYKPAYFYDIGNIKIFQNNDSSGKSFELVVIKDDKPYTLIADNFSQSETDALINGIVQLNK
jgi:hypothetical protein